ncbi:MAG: thioredoxin domain-containing protein, partial [Planctomycetes bacterium]|nr:thioredoxin domain-containing protein [Planctomycetota bacterium]
METRPSAASGPSVRKPLPGPEELKNLPPDGGPEFNRLVFEKSPYLLQHAANPVDWYPWGEEAFKKARKEDKPIFLSIGYSTCHWCHVMEHESFEDDEVAALMNEHFIAIKVDREERPDIDNIYMQACRAMGKRGGWPLTIMMTSDKVPFFSGTYFPKSGRFGREGMTELIPRMAEEWRNERAKLLISGRNVVSRLTPHVAQHSGAELGEAVLARAFELLSRSFDSTNGGFGRSPKFPTPHRLSFLLRYWRRSGDPKALRIVEKTLQSMRRGGIYDHIGFGFHRYSTDANWLVPHFEKMLYDQAMLVIAYVETYQATGNEEYARTVREVLNYVLRDMTDPEGGFYSAEDADSEGVEGKFNVWSADEIKKVLGDDADLYIKAYNIRPKGNFRNPHTPPASNIPHLKQSWAELAERLGTDEADLRRKLEASRVKLFAVRESRIHPYKDDKILTDWNGLMIAAMAKAAQALDAPEYAAAAQRAADFVWDHVRDSRGRLFKRHRGGESALPAHVADYAFMIWGLLDLYEANFEVRNLKRAIELNRQLLE